MTCTVSLQVFCSRAWKAVPMGGILVAWMHHCEGLGCGTDWGIVA